MAKTIAATEVAQHDKTDDIWIAVNGDVFDITDFAPEHPGGAESRSGSRHLGMSPLLTGHRLK